MCQSLPPIAQWGNQQATIRIESVPWSRVHGVAEAGLFSGESIFVLARLNLVSFFRSDFGPLPVCVQAWTRLKSLPSSYKGLYPQKSLRSIYTGLYPQKVTPVILHGAVSPDGHIDRGGTLRRWTGLLTFVFFFITPRPGVE